MPTKTVFSFGTVATFNFSILRISAGGVEGAGESLLPPTPFFLAALPQLIGADVRRRDHLLPSTDNRHDRVLCEALSMAIHDLLARLLSVPLCVLLGGLPP